MKKVLSLAMLCVCCVWVASAEDPKPGEGKKPFGKFEGKFDKAKMFERLDTNGDGKISKEEYTQSMESFMERIKTKLPEGKGGNLLDFATRRFEAMDANKDGVVTKEEFEKASGFGPFGGPGGPGGRFKGKGGFKRPDQPKD